MCRLMNIALQRRHLLYEELFDAVVVRSIYIVAMIYGLVYMRVYHYT